MRDRVLDVGGRLLSHHNFSLTFVTVWRQNARAVSCRAKNAGTCVIILYCVFHPLSDQSDHSICYNYIGIVGIVRYCRVQKSDWVHYFTSLVTCTVLSEILLHKNIVLNFAGHCPAEKFFFGGHCPAQYFFNFTITMSDTNIINLFF